MFGMGEVVVIYPRYFTGVLGYGMGDLAIALAAASLSYAFLQPLTGKLADRYNKRMLIATGFVAFIAATALISLLREKTAIYGAMLLFGVGGAVAFPASSSLLALISPKDRKGAYSGFYNMVLSLGVTISPVVIGAIVDAVGYPAGFTTTPFLAIATLTVFLIIFRKREK